MKISGNDDIARYVKEMAVDRSQESGGKAPTAGDAASGLDERTVVSLSQRSKDIQTARQVIDSEPDIRLEKVEAIKAKIENGTYEIDHGKTAEKFIDAFFEEMI